MRGALKVYGIKLGTGVGRSFRARVEKSTESCDDLVKTTMAALLASWNSLCEQIAVLDRQCKKQAKEDKVCRRLMTIPGVGTITALAFRSEIDDPARFSRSRDVGVHLGLTPKRYASGEIDRSGRISKCGNRNVRSLLFEAAQVMLTRSKRWSWLKAWGIKLAKRSSFRVACTATARKLAVIMHPPPSRGQAPVGG